MTYIGLIIKTSLRNNIRLKTVTIVYILVTLMFVAGLVVSLSIFLVAPVMEAESPDRSELELYLGMMVYAACFLGLGINLNSFAFQSIVREKSRGNIESLLATPLEAGDIWAAKSMAIFIPGLVVGEVLAFIVLVVVNYIYFVPSIGFVLNPWVFVSSFLAAPLVYLCLSFLVYLVGMTGKPNSGNIIAQIFLPVMTSLLINLAVHHILEITSYSFAVANVGIAAVITVIILLLRPRLTREKIILSR
jgi:ABC-2 type transport system permease protein